MKKHLLSTSAIALAVAAAPALAQDWTVGVGGYYNTHVGIGDVSGTGIAAGQDFDGINTLIEGEVHITPSITLDNGLTFGANIQYEISEGNASGAAGMDEVYVEVSGNFGRLVIGSENSAGYLLSVSAPSVSSLYINSPSISAFVPFGTTGGTIGNSFVGAGASGYVEVGPGFINSDVQRITYYTPDFNGLTVGVSYAPNSGTRDGANDGATDFNAATLSDIFDIGVNYNGSFGGGSVSLSARYGTADYFVGAPVNSDPEVWAVGASVSFGDFTIGGSYAENDNGDILGIAGNGDESGWALGITYDAPGPWAFGIETYQGEFDNGPGFADDEYQAYQLAASRDVGPGVDWDITYTRVETSSPFTGTIDGDVIATALNLSF